HVGEAAALLAQRSVDSSPEVHPEVARLPVQLLEVLAVDEGFREELARILTERHRLLAHAVRSVVSSPSEGTLGADRALQFGAPRSEEHTSELQSRENLVCRLLLEKKNRPRPRPPPPCAPSPAASRDPHPPLPRPVPALLRRPPPRSTLFPYTTLFRSSARNWRAFSPSAIVCSRTLFVASSVARARAPWVPTARSSSVRQSPATRRAVPISSLPITLSSRSEASAASSAATVKVRKASAPCCKAAESARMACSNPCASPKISRARSEADFMCSRSALNASPRAATAAVIASNGALLIARARRPAAAPTAALRVIASAPLSPRCEIAFAVFEVVLRSVSAVLAARARALLTHSIV